MPLTHLDLGLLCPRRSHHYQFVGQFVLIDGAGREMPREQLATLLDCGDESIGRPAGLDGRDHGRDGAFPSVRVDLGVNAPIGDNFSMTLRHGGKDQNARCGAR